MCFLQAFVTYSKWVSTGSPVLPGTTEYLSIHYGSSGTYLPVKRK